MERIFVIIAGLMGFLGIIAGTVGAHLLKDFWKVDPKLLNSFEVGVRYHFYHVFALLASAWLVKIYGSKAATTSGRLFIVGTVIFSGSLYLYGMTGERTFARVAPIGGLLLMGGWLSLSFAAFNSGINTQPAERAN